MPTQAQRNKTREKYQSSHKPTKAEKYKARTQREPHRVNTDQPQPTTDLTK